MDQPNLNSRQRRCLDVVNDYDCEIVYHSGKTNMVADVLSRRVVSIPRRGSCMRVMITSLLLELVREAHK